jgi:6-bladed beta-propeller
MIHERTQARLFLPVFATLFAACTARDAGRSVVERDSAGVHIVESSSPAWRENAAWIVSPRPAVQIGAVEGNTNDQLFRVTMAKRLHDGRIVILNAGSNEMRIYSPTGGHIRSVGQEGQGPGEFRYPRTLWIGTSDTLIVGDFERFSIFDSSGVFVRNESFGRSAPLDRFSDGTFLRMVFAPGVNPYETGYARPDYSLVRTSADAMLADTLVRLSGDETFRFSPDGRGIAAWAAPFGARRLVTLHSDHILTTDGATFEVRELDSDGSLIRIVRTPATPLPVTRQDIANLETGMLEPARDEQQRTMLNQLFAAWTYPSVQPASDQLFADSEGDTWMRHFQAGSADTAEWRIFDPSGRWLGDVSLPGRLTIFEIGDDYILGLAHDDLDVEYVRLYTITK